MEKNKKKTSVPTIIIYIFFGIMTIIYLLPLLWVVLVSLKTRQEIIKKPFALPEIPQWENYSFA